jgi:VIT1/CCC1 family predicted Fe2+/Mn2+ transporter
MKEQIKKLTNFSFGGTSAIITNMSLIIGFGSTGVPKSAIIGGILVIAVADNISDSLGIHIYKESECSGTKEPFISTIFNFITRLFISLVFVVIMMLFPIPKAQIISSIWGLFALSTISYFISIRNKKNPATEMLKHLGVVIIVIIASKYVGDFIHSHFKKLL